MKINQILDQLVATGNIVDETELINVALNGFTKPPEPFVKRVYAQEKLPN